MLAKYQIKYLSSLKLKKNRTLNNEFTIEGTRIVTESIKAMSNSTRNYSIEKIIISNSFEIDKKNASFIKKINKSYNIEKISNDNMSKISNVSTPPGIIALIKQKSQNKFSNNGPILLLDDISNPGNLGTILRSAEWFGIKHVYLSENTVDPYNSKTIQSAAGAHFYLSGIIQTDLIDVINFYKKYNFQIIGTSLNGCNINSMNINNNWALILGNEGHGISKEINKYIDKSITIDKFGNIESLNVAMAGSIILSKLMNRKGNV